MKEIQSRRNISICRQADEDCHAIKMNSMPKNFHATFFLNTGRCGSQFFASKLAEHYHDIARVEHEPHKEEYQPPVSFSMLHRGEQLEISPTLREHFESIDETLETRHYVEAGWPSYGMLPYLVERFKGRIRIVHLYRHPAKVAASLTTHNVYDRGEWSNKMSITPEHSGVIQGHLGGDRWKSMDEFCKCPFLVDRDQPDLARFQKGRHGNTLARAQV